MRERQILHLNVADFAVAVERLVDSRLRDRPVLIAPAGAARSAVFDMSEEAFRSGVRKGMALNRALKLCRDAAVLPPHPDRYERAMRELLTRTLPYTPLIEQTDTQGHLFLDLSGTGRLHGPPPDVGWKLRRAIKTDLGLNPIWSLAANKLVAKAASRLVKPTGEYIVGGGEEETFLRPLPLQIIPGLERDDLTRFREFNLTRVADAAKLSSAQLATAFGRRGSYLHQVLRGVDDSPVLPVGEKPPVVTAEHVFGDDANDTALLDAALFALVESAGLELRERRLVARRIGVVLDYSDGVRVVRSVTVEPATANDFVLFDAARRVLTLAWTRRLRVRCLKLACDRLTFPSGQLELFAEIDDEKERQDNLVAAIDRIRKRFGDCAVRWGRSAKLSEQVCIDKTPQTPEGNDSGGAFHERRSQGHSDLAGKSAARGAAGSDPRSVAAILRAG